MSTVGSDPRSLAGRPQQRSARLGQVLTPPGVAAQMAHLLLRDRPQTPITILDPCVGPGTFPDALRLRAGDRLTAIDVDPLMLAAAAGRPRTHLVEADFLRWTPPAPFDAVILNPPYLRQEWLDDKPDLIRRTEAATGARVPGTANLYVHFLVRAVAALRPGGRMAAIVYDSWRHTRYGRWLQQHLDTTCEHVEYETVAAPFRGRMIDATIISAVRAERVRPPRAALTIDAPHGLTSIDAQYATARGLRLKQADFFLCRPGTPGATPFVKRVRHVAGFAVAHDHPEAALLVPPGEPPPPELRARLQYARANPDDNVPILTWARDRPQRWWTHRPAPHAPILVNYYLRGRPRHILSSGLAFSDNFYGLTPRGRGSVHAHLALLNGSTAASGILAESRPQGAGLRKVQLFEYRAALVPDVEQLDDDALERLDALGRRLVTGDDVRAHIDRVV